MSFNSLGDYGKTISSKLTLGTGKNFHSKDSEANTVKLNNYQTQPLSKTSQNHENTINNHSPNPDLDKYYIKYLGDPKRPQEAGQPKDENFYRST